MSSAIVLAVHKPDLLFLPNGVKATDLVPPSSFVELSIFHHLPVWALEPFRWLLVGILLVIAAGLLGRLGAILHWWIAHSLAVSLLLVEGGEQLAANLTLLLIPLIFLRTGVGPLETAHVPAKWSVQRVAWVAIRVQMAVVYFQAATAKLEISQWVDGTAMYYWLQNPMFGAPATVKGLLLFVFSSPVGVFITWAILALEILLFMALVIDPKWWKIVLIVGLALHAGIAVMHGLVTFSLVMAAGLLLYLSDPWQGQIRVRVPSVISRYQIGSTYPWIRSR